MIMWCEATRRRIHVQICVSCECKHRARCQAYAELSARDEAQAMADVRRHGHAVRVPAMPLLEARHG